VRRDVVPIPVEEVGEVQPAAVMLAADAIDQYALKAQFRSTDQSNIGDDERTCGAKACSIASAGADSLQIINLLRLRRSTALHGCDNRAFSHRSRLLFLQLAQFFNPGAVTGCLSCVRGHCLRPTPRFGRGAAYAAYFGPADAFATRATISGAATFSALCDCRSCKTKQYCNGDEEPSGHDATSNSMLIFIKEPLPPSA